jgi:ribonuclease D
VSARLLASRHPPTTRNPPDDLGVPPDGGHARIQETAIDRFGSRAVGGRWTRSRPSSEIELSTFEIITEKSELEKLSKQLLREDVVAFDTEADSFYHYFDKVCLVQVATRKKCWLIDPLGIEGPEMLAALAPVFDSPKVRVLFHAAEYDIYVLKRDCGFEFTNLFDTMVCAQLLGYPSIGLAALVERHFGVVLPKDEQRSDWSRRPLSDKQLSYAASDVLYLIKLAEKLEKDLRKAGRLDWAVDEFETLCGRRWPDREFDKLGYLRIKGARSMDPIELGVLRELFLLRDKRAREIDRPPFKVLGNRTLLEISRAQSADLDSLAEIKGITDLILKRLGKDLVAAVKKGLRKPHGPIPRLETASRRRMDKRTEKRLGALKDWRGPRSEALKLDPGVLCPNAALESIAWANPENAEDLKALPDLKTWFVREFASEIVGVIERHVASEESKEEVEAKDDGQDDGRPKGSGRRSGRSRGRSSKAKGPSSALSTGRTKSES